MEQCNVFFCNRKHKIVWFLFFMEQINKNCHVWNIIEIYIFYYPDFHIFKFLNHRLIPRFMFVDLTKNFLQMYWYYIDYCCHVYFYFLLWLHTFSLLSLYIIISLFFVFIFSWVLSKGYKIFNNTFFLFCWPICLP